MRWIPSALIIAAACLAPIEAAAQPSIERPALLGIDHVAFLTSSAEEAREFYGTLLGLPVVEGRTSTTALVIYLNDRQRLLLEPGLPPEQDERLSHVALATDDLAGMREYLVSRKIAVTPTALQPCGAQGLRVRDPDGHTIELVEEHAPMNPPASRRALSTRLLHAGITVRNEAAAHAFYRDVLGLSEIWRGGSEPGRTSWVNMRVPEGTDYLEYMLVDGEVSRRQLGVLHHACLTVADIQQAWDTVRARTPPEARGELRPPQVGRNNRWQLNLYDPDGTRVELMEPWTVR